jgi:dimethylargininase
VLDPTRALAQHAAFCAALEGAGVLVERLPPEPALADAPFVSDVLLCFAPVRPGAAPLAVLARPGASSRVGEVASVAARAPALVSPGARIVAIEQPGTLDGGDVILIGDHVAIGVSARTNEAGAKQLAAAVRDAGYRATLCPVEGRLHLASAVTVVDPQLLVGTRDGFASLDALGVLSGSNARRILVDDAHADAANVLSLGETCFVIAGHPPVEHALAGAGRKVVAVELGEFVRADAGPTCLVSILR